MPDIPNGSREQLAIDKLMALVIFKTVVLLVGPALVLFSDYDRHTQWRFDGIWRRLCNVGPAVVNASGSPPTAPVSVGPYSALILSQTPAPTLAISQDSGRITVSWPIAASSWVLETALGLLGNPVWTRVPTAQYQTNTTNAFVTAPALSGNSYFRLRKL